MRIEEFDQTELPDGVFERGIEFLSCKETNFAAQVNFLGLDPSCDFMHADLSHTDFSNSDIRGFNFTGADLRHAVGLNITWDVTTIFTDADAGDSVFAYDIEKAKYFDAHPEDAETVRRFAGEHWANSILGVERLLQTDKGQGSSVWIARGVFEQTKSSVVRSNVLAFMRLATESADEHKSFIYNIFARFTDQEMTVLGGIRTLSTFYRDDADAFNWLKLFLENKSERMRVEAFKGLIISKHFFRAYASIRNYAVNSQDPLVRRIFLKRLAKLTGPSVEIACQDITVTNALDFAEPISARKLEEKAFKELQLFALRNRDTSTSHNIRDVVTAVRVERSEVLKLARKFKEQLEELGKRFKIPFVFV